MAFVDWRGRAACLTHQSLSGERAEGLLPDARVVFTNQLSNSLKPSTAGQGELKTLLSVGGKYGMYASISLCLTDLRDTTGHVKSCWYLV